MQTNVIQFNAKQDNINKGDIKQAIASLQENLSKTSNSAEQAACHNNLSICYQRLGNIELAIRHLNQALRIIPNSSEKYNNLGSLHYKQKQIKPAIECFSKAIRLNPDNWEAHYNLANSFIQQNATLKAIDHYNAALKLNPDKIDIKQNLGMAYVINEDFAAAKPFLEQAIQHNPNLADLHAQLAEVYLETSQPEQALESFTTAINLNPKQAAWQHNLAVLYLRFNQKGNALLHFKEALKLNPDNQTAKHMVNALQGTTQDNAPQDNICNGAQDNIAQTSPEYITELFDQYASFYNNHMQKTLNYQVPNLMRQQFSGYLGSCKNILELGCGTGICGIYFRDLAKFMVGVDLSSQMLHYANQLGAYDALCQGNIMQSIPGQNQNYFDLIIAADVFVYLGDLEEILQMAITALRPQGQIIFSIEDLSSNSGYRLLTTGRYAHSLDYIKKISNNLGLTIQNIQSATLRTYNGQPTYGNILVMSI